MLQPLENIFKNNFQPTKKGLSQYFCIFGEHYSPFYLRPLALARKVFTLRQILRQHYSRVTSHIYAAIHNQTNA